MAESRSSIGSRRLLEIETLDTDVYAVDSTSIAFGCFEATTITRN